MNVGVIVHHDVKLHFLASMNYKGIMSAMALSCESFLCTFLLLFGVYLLKNSSPLVIVSWKPAHKHVIFLIRKIGLLFFLFYFSLTHIFAANEQSLVRLL